MSIEAMALVLHHSQMTGSAKLLLLGIANHQGDEGAWPSVSTLAKYTGTSERRVQQLLGELTASGELEVNYQAGPTGTNRYFVTVSCPQDCDRSPQHRGGEILFTGGVKSSSPQGVKPASPEPSLEPSLNQKERATRLSEDWNPTTELIEWARTEFPHLDVQLQNDAFIDYWLSKASNATKRDWNRTWKNWMRTAAQRTAPRQAQRRTAAEDNWNVVMKYQKGVLNG